MYPFVASQAIALKQAKRTQPKPALRNAVADPLVQTVRKGLLKRFLDALVESRRRKADLEIEAHTRLDDIGTHKCGSPKG